MRRALVVAPLAVCLLCSAGLGANLLTNPGFAQPPGTSCAFNQGAPSGWTSTGPTGLDRNASIWVPACPSAAFGGDSDGLAASISTGAAGNGTAHQTVTIPAADGNTTYRFNGIYAGGGPTGAKAYFALVAGSDPNAAPAAGAGLTTNSIPGTWTPFAVQLKPSAGTTQLTCVFRLINPNTGCCTAIALFVDAVNLDVVNLCPNLPEITSISPTNAVRGTNNFNLTISGNNFSSASGTPTVKLLAPTNMGGSDITAKSVTVNNSTQVTAVFDLPNNAIPGPDWGLSYAQPQCTLTTVTDVFLMILPTLTNGSFEQPNVGQCVGTTQEPTDWRWMEPQFGEWGYGEALNLNGFFRADRPELTFKPTCPQDGNNYATSATARGANFAKSAIWQTVAVTPGQAYTFSGLWAASGDLETFIDLLDGAPDYPNFPTNPANLLARQTVQNGTDQFDWRFFYVQGTPSQNHVTVVWRNRSLGAPGTIASHAESLALDPCSNQATVSSITPDRGVNNGVVNITNLSGNNFTGTPTVVITREGAARTATSVNVVNGNTITCQINLAGLPSGWYDVVVKQGGCIATIANGFLVVGASFVNGSFELPTVAGICPPGPILGVPTGWTQEVQLVRDHNVHKPDTCPSPDGGHYGSMTAAPGQSPRAYQIIQVVPGSTYTFKGYFTANGSSSRRIALINGTIKGGVIDGTVVAETPVPDGGAWTERVVEGAATGSIMTVMMELTGATTDSALHADGLKFEIVGVPCNAPFADSDNDGDVDQDDFGLLQQCFTGPAGGIPNTGALEYCRCFDRNFDQKIEQNDVTAFNNCSSGPNVPWTSSANCP